MLINMQRFVNINGRRFGSGFVELLFRTMSDTCGPIQATITKKLTERLKPEHIEVINESYMHSVPKGSESHFRVIVVSNEFEGLNLLKRHRIVFDTLSVEMDSAIHALSIEAKTPSQWSSGDGKTQKSPPCLGGMKK